MKTKGKCGTCGGRGFTNRSSAHGETGIRFEPKVLQPCPDCSGR